MSHTKGKVKVGLFGLETPDWDRRTIFDDQDNFFADTETSTKTYEEEYANARRLVACWNLLLPFTTEEIEAGIDLEKLMRENAALKEEVSRLNSALMRDAISYIQNVERVEVFPVYAKDEKLRKAAEDAERLISYWRGYAPPILQPEELQVIENLRAALNKVES